MLFLSSRVAHSYWDVRDARIVIGPGLLFSAQDPYSRIGYAVFRVRKRGPLWRRWAAQWSWRCSSHLKNLKSRRLVSSFCNERYGRYWVPCRYVQGQFRESLEKLMRCGCCSSTPRHEILGLTDKLHAFQQRNGMTTIKPVKSVDGCVTGEVQSATSAPATSQSGRVSWSLTGSKDPKTPALQKHASSTPISCSKTRYSIPRTVHWNTTSPKLL